ncbi:cell adhesion molecule Dscam1-like isoform X2 [Ornithodoros turicata]|uniref:cell adhesion molecule Dscam1-like isoform X2 n=1 Tax=Ornithodoros turicata TaxID=34597 RepID=UPI003138CABF
MRLSSGAELVPRRRHFRSCLSVMLLRLPLNILLPVMFQGARGMFGAPSTLPLGFTDEPPDHVFFINTMGGSVRCSGYGSPPPIVSWVEADGNGSRGLAPSSAGLLPLGDMPGLRHTSPDGTTLIFPPFKAVDFRAHVHAAGYRCILSNPLGKMASRVSYVRAVIQQEYEVSVHDGFATRGSTAVLTCQIQPVAVRDFTSVLSWLRDDKYVIRRGQSDEKYTVYPSGELYIHEVDDRDAERSYRCQVLDHSTNSTRSSNRAAKIILQGPRKGGEAPRVTSWVKEVIAQDGEMASLSCAARGQPLPSYHWFRQSGLELRPVPGAMHFGRGTLMFRTVRPEDSGRYVCLVNNTYGEDRVYVVLTVKGSPVVSVQPTYQRVPLGSSVTLTCNTSSILARELRWYKDLAPVQPSSADKVRLISSSVLQLGSVKANQDGIYQCMAFGAKESAQAVAFVILMVTKPELTVTFGDQNTYPGSFVSLKCAARGHPMPRVTWRLDGGPVPSSRRVLRGDFVTEDHVVHSFVNLTSANVTHSGEYSCHADNDAGHVSHAAWLNVVGAPVALPPRNITLLAGETFTLPCPVKGYPLASFAWYKGLLGNRTLVDGQRYRMDKKGRLTIHDVDRKADNGPVVCAATSPEGRSSEGVVNLHVAVPPSINPFSFPPSVREGERSSVHCFVSAGDRPVSIHWLKDGHPLQLGYTDVKPQLMNEFLSVLYFESIAESHNGTYTCVASNPYARANASAQMIVQVAPRWIHAPVDATAIKGETSRFDCQADGFPTPVIRWKMTTGGLSESFTTIRSNAKLQVLENGSLVVQHVEASDSGVYLCQATNGVGPELTHEARLTVSVPASFVSSSMSVTARRGEKVHLRCEAIGDVPLTIAWYKNKSLLDMDQHSRYSVMEYERDGGLASQLLVRDVKTNDSATYTCKVANTHGSDEMFIKLTVQETPSAPSNVHVSHLGSRSVSVRWSPPFDGNSPVTQYDLKFHSARDGTSRVIPIPGNQLEMTLDDLSPNSAYRVEIEAVNNIGTGPPSEPLFFTTDIEAPAAKPRELKVIPINSTSLRVTWKPPVGETKITGYYVGYKMDPEDQTESYVYKTVEATSGVSQECDVKDLRPGTKYVVLVQAYNGKGPGPSSDEVTGETPTSDLASLFRVAVNYTTYTEIRITWQDVFGSRHGYKLFIRANGSDWESYKVTSTSNTYAFTNLRCGTRYEIYVEALSDTPTRPRTTSIVMASTTGSAPVAPTHQQPLLVDSESVPLDLEAFGDGGCPVTYYVVKYKALDEKEWTVLSREPHQALKNGNHVVSLTNLERGRRYKLLLGAANAAGYTEALYDVHVASASKGTASPQEMHRKLAVVTSVVCSVVVLIVIVVAACVELSRRRRGRADAAASEVYSEPRLKPPGKCEEMALTTWEKRKECVVESATRNGDIAQQQQALYAPCPYGSTSGRITQDNAPTTLGRRSRTRAELVEEFYDMPLPPGFRC